MASLWRWLFPKRESAETAVEAPRRRPPARTQKKPPSQRSTVYSEEYLPREHADTVVQVDDQGMPNLRLKRVRDTLVLEAPGGEWINPYSATVRRLGITICKVRGASYYEEGTLAGSFSPWSKVRLVREPDNEYDTNAIAVYSNRGGHMTGYVNKGNARRLAKLIDGGSNLVAISIRGGAAGKHGPAMRVLVTTPEILAHLRGETD